MGLSALPVLMYDVFISSARSDSLRAAQFQHAIKRCGWTVWDADLLPEEQWNDVIEKELRAAGAVLVLWSKESVKSQFVCDEATIARELGKLVPVTLDGQRPKVGLGQLQLEDVSSWNGLDPDHPSLIRVLSGIREVLKNRSGALQKATHLHRFNVDSKQSTLPSGSSSRGRVSRMAAIGGVLVAAMLAAVAVWKMSIQNEDSVPKWVVEARKANVTHPQFLKPTSDDEAPSTSDATLLLFVHGVFGDTVSTWSRGDLSQSLPSLLLARKEFSRGFDAFAFGYMSEIVRRGSFQIHQAATAFATEIKFRSFLTKYKRIVIVAHSMGGLVALEALTTDPEIRAHVPLVVTFATPYDGAQIATLGNDVLSNPGLADMVPRDARNSFLSSLSNRWKRSRNSGGPTTKVVCAYESVPLSGIPGIGLVVPETSASSLCDDVAEPIAEDHIGIIKPDGPEHQSIKVLTNALRALSALTASIAPEAALTNGQPPAKPAAESQTSGRPRDTEPTSENGVAFLSDGVTWFPSQSGHEVPNNAIPMGQRNYLCRWTDADSERMLFKLVGPRVNVGVTDGGQCLGRTYINADKRTFPTSDKYDILVGHALWRRTEGYPVSAGSERLGLTSEAREVSVYLCRVRTSEGGVFLGTGLITGSDRVCNAWLTGHGVPVQTSDYRAEFLATTRGRRIGAP